MIPLAQKKKQQYFPHSCSFDIGVVLEEVLKVAFERGMFMEERSLVCVTIW